MIVLGIHTCTPSLGVAITQDAEILGESILISNQEHVERIAGTLEDLTGRLGLSFGELDGIGVAIGPGSFSGIRVGMATAKGMALALRKPLVGLSSLEILAWAALRTGETGVAAIDARRGQLYVALYRRENWGVVVMEEPRIVPVQSHIDRAREDPHLVTACEDRDPSLPFELTNLGIRRVAVSRPAACALLAEQQLRMGKQDDLHRLAPLYIRPSDAEANRASG